MKIKIINKKAFYFGIILLLVSVFIIFVPTTTTKGNFLNDWTGKIFILSLSLLFLFYALFPKSILGIAGKYIFNFYSKINKK